MGENADIQEIVREGWKGVEGGRRWERMMRVREKERGLGE